MVVLAEKGLEASICREKRRITVAKVPFPDLLEMLGGIVLLVMMTTGCGFNFIFANVADTFSGKNPLYPS